MGIQRIRYLGAADRTEWGNRGWALEGYSIDSFEPFAARAAEATAVYVAALTSPALCAFFYSSARAYLSLVPSVAHANGMCTAPFGFFVLFSPLPSFGDNGELKRHNDPSSEAVCRLVLVTGTGIVHEPLTMATTIIDTDATTEANPTIDPPSLPLRPPQSLLPLLLMSS